MVKYINLLNVKKSLNNFNRQKPFPFAIVDNFFKKNIAKQLEKEFPVYNSKNLHEYNNYCEIKKSSNNWNLFPPLTYKIFTELSSEKIINLISKKTKIPKIFPDYGLNGGGWHMMNSKGRLNPHLDYSMHPKINAQRKINLIIFLSEGWKKNWGGETSFFSRNHQQKKMPGALMKKIYPKFNRAILFDTSKTSWHAVEPIKIKKIRKSIAVYYLIPVKKNKRNMRQKALYAPTKKQIGSKQVLKFIKLRSNPKLFAKVYKTK
mgnify:CR=1 FL=1|tara:strand:+ start:6177 stop:6962 length:786 start_codon:yes stop_codon:yes gene_type:complete